MNEIRKMFLSELKEFKRVSFRQKCSKLSFLCLCAFYFDCSFSGSGRYMMIGPLSLRMVLGFFAALFILPELLRNIKQYLRTPLIMLVFLLSMYVAICAIRGYFLRNDAYVLVTDIKGFMWLFLMPVLIATVQTKKRFEGILTSICVGSLVQAIYVSVVNAVCALVPESSTHIHNIMSQIQMGLVDGVSLSINRIFMRSTVYMIASCAFVVFRQIRTERIQLRYVVSLMLYLNACLLSYTRSFYGCLFVVIVCGIASILICYRRKAKLFFKYCTVTVILFFAFVFVQEFVLNGSFFNFAISRTFGVEPKTSIAVMLRESFFEEELGSSTGNTSDLDEIESYINRSNTSDSLRADTQKELLRMFGENPVFGNGLGASVYFRKTGLDEYFYLDVLARMGILGMIFYLLPFAYVLSFSIKNRKRMAQFADGIAFICGFMGFWAFTWFHPLMNAALGIAMYALCCSIPKVLTEEG